MQHLIESTTSKYAECGISPRKRRTMRVAFYLSLVKLARKLGGNLPDDLCPTCQKKTRAKMNKRFALAHAA